MTCKLFKLRKTLHWDPSLRCDSFRQPDQYKGHPFGIYRYDPGDTAYLSQISVNLVSWPYNTIQEPLYLHPMQYNIMFIDIRRHIYS